MMKPYPAYKESGIEWLGEIPAHWNAVLFKRIIQAIKDGTHGSYQRVEQGLPLLSAKNVYFDGIKIEETESLISEADFNEITSNGFPQKGDLLLTIVGTIGRAFVFDRNEPLAFQRSVAFLRLNAKAHPQFYYYLLQSNVFSDQLMSAAKTSAQSGVYMGDIVQTIVLTLPLEEQRAIVDYLDRKTAVIETLIAKKERQIELLQEQRTAVINHAVTKGLNPHSPRKDSGIPWLGQIPAHWQTGRAKQVSGIFVPQRNKPDLNTKTGTPWITMEDLVNSAIEKSTLGYLVSEQAAKQAGSKTLQANSVIASCVGNFGVSSINTVPVIINQQLQAYIPQRINLWYLKYLVTISSNYFELVATAATLAYVNQERFGDLPILLPPENEQTAIVQFIEKKLVKFDNLLGKIRQEIELLREYRTAVISAAVTGKIDVRP